MKNKELNDLLNYTRLNSSTIQEVHENFIKIYQAITGSVIIFDNWNNMSFQKISNTHNCPINGVTNFSCKDDKPRFYYGWKTWITGNINQKDYEKKKFNFNGEIKYLYKSFTFFDSLDYQLGFSHGTFNGGHKFSGEFMFFFR